MLCLVSKAQTHLGAWKGAGATSPNRMLETCELSAWHCLTRPTRDQNPNVKRYIFISALPMAAKTMKNLGRENHETLEGPSLSTHLAVKTHLFVASARYGRENCLCPQSQNFVIGNNLVPKVVIEWPSRLAGKQSHSERNILVLILCLSVKASRADSSVSSWDWKYVSAACIDAL